jgi:hypothetical protein
MKYGGWERTWQYFFLTQGLDLLTQGLDLLIQGLDLLSQGLDLLTQGLDLRKRDRDYLKAFFTAAASAISLRSKITEIRICALGGW